MKSHQSLRLIYGGLKEVLRGIAHLPDRFLQLPEDLKFWLDQRDWDFGDHVEGKKGETKTITLTPQCLFRAEKMMATDSVRRDSCETCGSPHDSRRGFRTRIKSVMVGKRLQRPAGAGGSLTLFFAPGAYGNGVTWDTCKPWEEIQIVVEFLEDCVFDCTVFGKCAF